MKHARTAPLAVSLLLGGLCAQAQPGQPAPEVEFTHVFNDGPQSWEETAGKVVLLDFSETW